MRSTGDRGSSSKINPVSPSALVSDLRERIGFRELRHLLRKKNLAVGASWEDLLAKLENPTALEDGTLLSTLQSLHHDLILAGTKDAFLVALGAKTTGALLNELQPVTVSSGIYRENFPFSLAANVLAGLPEEHHLVEKVVHPNGDISCVLASKRSVEERKVYGLNEVTSAVQQAFVGYDEFIAIKRVHYQVFDVLTVRKRLHRIEVLVDHPDRIRGDQTSEERAKRILRLMAANAPTLADFCDLEGGLNLAPCISAMYHKADEGRVTRMSFRSPTGSVNRGLQPKQTDLRKDRFHKGGVQAVGDVTPYDVTICWEDLAKMPGKVSLQIGMPIYGLSAEHCVVNSARVTDAKSDAQLAAVLNKLVSYS